MLYYIYCYNCTPVIYVINKHVPSHSYYFHFFIFSNWSLMGKMVHSATLPKSMKDYRRLLMGLRKQSRLDESSQHIVVDMLGTVRAAGC